jgi:signal recognition particle receptor subunit beta
VSSVNLFTREVTVKIVYSGPSFAGKSSSLSFVHRSLRPDSRGPVATVDTGVDRTLSFDCLPVNLPKVQGYSIRIQLFTVPGTVHYNSTRKQVLAGADGVVFVADSQRARRDDNVASFENLRDNLAEHGLRIESLAHVFQWNKRDLPDLLGVDELHQLLNSQGVRSFASVAVSGEGVFEALTAVTTLAIADLRSRGLLEASQDPMTASLSPPVPRPDPSIEREVKALSDTPDQGQAPETPPLPLTTVVRAAAPPFAASPAPPPPSRFPAATVTSPTPVLPPPAASTPPRAAPHLSPSWPARPALALLLPDGSARSHVAAAEVELSRGRFNQAVRVAARAFNEAARPRASTTDVASVLHALLVGIDGRRYLRFCEAAARADHGLCTQEDALFAIFFLVDAALDR